MNDPQPNPTPNEQPAVWDLVMADMRERDATGRVKYGTPLQPFNGRDALVDAYQESLDLVVYLRQAIFERQAVVASRAVRILREFHEAFGQPINTTPSAAVPEAIRNLRVRLIDEEAGEFYVAATKGDIVGIADALADLVYVIYGTALVYGIDLDACLEEVHRSNMTKLTRDGGVLLRGDGKILKPDTYEPPNLLAVLGLEPQAYSALTHAEKRLLNHE